MVIKKWFFCCITLSGSFSLVLHAPQVPTSVQEEKGIVAPPKRSERHISIAYKQITVGGRTFTHRDDWDHITGKRSEVWSVDGATVSQQEYEAALKEAEVAQWEAERVYELALHQQHLEQRDRVAQLGALKLLEVTVCSLETALKQLDDDMLRPFYAFGNSSIATEDVLNELRDEQLPQARKMVRMKTDATVQEMVQLQEQLEPLVDQLHTFFYASIEHAIKQADDPRVLKKWLSVVT